LNHAPLTSNKLPFPVYYIQICFFFAFNTFVLCVATDQLQPQSAEPRLTVPRHDLSRPQPSSSLPHHDPGWLQPPTQRSGRAMAPAGRSLPLNAAAAPWPRHGPGQVCQGHCRSRPATQSHSHTAATLKINGKKSKNNMAQHGFEPYTPWKE
jgi:hypothetical protein